MTVGPYTFTESGHVDYPVPDPSIDDRAWLAMVEENTGTEASRIDVIRRRCVEAGYPETGQNGNL